MESANVFINFDFSKNPRMYLHCIGRPSRFGHLRLGINFVTHEDSGDLYMKEKELGTKIPPAPYSPNT